MKLRYSFDEYSDYFEFEVEPTNDDMLKYMKDTYGDNDSVVRIFNDLDDADLIWQWLDEDNDDFKEWLWYEYEDEAKEAYEDAELYNNNIDMYYGV